MCVLYPLPSINFLTIPARKYRDEPRPRQGLLRTREFLMKDLYTFDASEPEALDTYKLVRNAYKAFFDELKVPYLVAQAHSGDIGGDVSHEYQLPSDKGEDVILSCSKCDFVVNEELESDNLFTKGSSAALQAARDRDVAKWGNSDTIGEEAEDDHKFELNSSGSSGDIGTVRPSNEDYEENEDVHAESPGDAWDEGVVTKGFKVWHGVTADRSFLLEAVIPRTIKVVNKSGGISHWRETEFCTNSIRKYYPAIDLSVEQPLEVFKQKRDGREIPADAERCSTTSGLVHYLGDYRLSRQARERWKKSSRSIINKLGKNVHVEESKAVAGMVKIAAGDPCPRCSEGAVKITKAIEVGHTFHLGTRYSEPLGACFTPSPSQRTTPKVLTTAKDANSRGNSNLPTTEQTQPSPLMSASQSSQKAPMQMGCHGVGISRLIAAVADILADTKGLNWPRVMAPFEVVVIAKDEHQDQIPAVCKALNAVTSGPGPASGGSMNVPLDIVIDDREQGLGWKLNDADLIGYPIIVILGKRYEKERLCEIQCRRLGVKEDVHSEQLNGRVNELLREL